MILGLIDSAGRTYDRDYVLAEGHAHGHFQGYPFLIMARDPQRLLSRGD